MQVLSSEPLEKYGTIEGVREDLIYYDMMIIPDILLYDNNIKLCVFIDNSYRYL